MTAQAQSMGMFDYFRQALSKYTVFTGRSRRSEYWYFTLVSVILAVVLTVLGVVTDATVIFSVLQMVLNLALLLPSLAVGARRLHDTGRSGWWLLLALIPLANLVVLYWLVVDSEPGANKFGPNPKTGATDEDVMRHLVD